MKKKVLNAMLNAACVAVVKTNYMDRKGDLSYGKQNF